MLGSVEILTRELAHACGDPFVQPSLFQPPGIEAKRIRARHAAGAAQEPKICSQIAAALPERCGMEIQSVLTDQHTQVDVYGSPESVPTRESFLLLTLNVPERVAYVLEVKPHTTFEQAGPLATPVTKEMPVRALACLMTVRAAKRFPYACLGISPGRKEAQRGPH